MEYYPSIQKMYCSYCGNTYSVEELHALQGEEEEKEWDAIPAGLDSGEPLKFGESPEDVQGLLIPSDDVRVIARKKLRAETMRHATIKMQILHCNACGGELAVNGVEVSSFCPYCGQATVVLDRVDECLQPDYIIPFKITKGEAELIIRNKISRGFFISDEMKNFEVEKLRGIYVPFWLYDLWYGDDQVWKYTVKRGKSSVTRYSTRIGECDYSKVTLDASRKLDDDSSRRLEPFHLEELQKFDPMYLSGFYADRFDVGLEESDQVAIMRAKRMFNDAMKKTISHSGAELISSNPCHVIKKRDYALLPVWFLTFRQDGMSYTIMVNGQTGKMVGALPYVKNKTYAAFGILAGALSAVILPISVMISKAVLYDFSDGRTLGAYFVLTPILAFTVWIRAIKKYKAYEQSVNLTMSGATSKFVKERADK